jgi:hypothetical protein
VEVDQRAPRHEDVDGLIHHRQVVGGSQQELAAWKRGTFDAMSNNERRWTCPRR